MKHVKIMTITGTYPLILAHSYLVAHTYSLAHSNIEQEDECVKSTFQPLQVLCEVNGFIIPAIIDTGIFTRSLTHSYALTHSLIQGHKYL